MTFTGERAVNFPARRDSAAVDWLVICFLAAGLGRALRARSKANALQARPKTGFGPEVDISAAVFSSPARTNIAVIDPAGQSHEKRSDAAGFRPKARALRTGSSEAA
jgi:hypothetical protein